MKQHTLISKEGIIMEKVNIYLTCPICGNSEWTRDEDAGFKCCKCGESCYPEDMGAVVVDTQ